MDFYDGVMSLGVEFDDDLGWVSLGVSDFLTSVPSWYVCAWCVVSRVL